MPIDIDLTQVDKESGKNWLVRSRRRARMRLRRRKEANRNREGGDKPLTEAVSESHTYSSTQLDLDDASYAGEEHDALGVILGEMASKIIDKDLDGPGRMAVEDMHLTTLYGLHDSSPDAVAELVRGFGPVSATLGATKVFEAGDPDSQRGGPEFDVVYVSIHGPDVSRLNMLLRQLPHSNKFVNFAPHICLAYTRPGSGWKYTDMLGVDGLKLTWDSLVFSSMDGERVMVSLLGE